MAESNKNAKSEYAEQLKAYRKAANVSQEKLAKAIGVHQPYIASIEAGALSIGIDKQEEIARYFGVKYYVFSNPNEPIPSLAELRESIEEYVRSTNTEAGYLHNESPNYSRYIDDLLATNFLTEARTAKEIANELKLLFGLEMQAARVSDILTRAPRNLVVDTIRPEQGKGNKYKLK